MRAWDSRSSLLSLPVLCPRPPHSEEMTTQLLTIISGDWGPFHSFRPRRMAPPLRVPTQRPTHLQGASSSGTLITRAHSYVPKLRAPGQPSNEGHICTALTLSLYSPESHGQKHTAGGGTRSPLCPARGADGTIAVGGELCKAASGTEGALGGPAPSEHTQTRRPRRLGHLGLPVPPSYPPTAAPPTLLETSRPAPGTQGSGGRG